MFILPNIVLYHTPLIRPNDLKKFNIFLLLCGHMHGGQMFPLAYFGKLSGANDEAYGLHKRGTTDFIVSSGISDWRAFFKTGTIAEYVVVIIKK